MMDPQPGMLLPFIDAHKLVLTVHSSWWPVAHACGGAALGFSGRGRLPRDLCQEKTPVHRRRPH